MITKIQKAKTIENTRTLTESFLFAKLLIFHLLMLPCVREQNISVIINAAHDVIEALCELVSVIAAVGISDIRAFVVDGVDHVVEKCDFRAVLLVDVLNQNGICQEPSLVVLVVLELRREQSKIRFLHATIYSQFQFPRKSIR